MDMQSFACTPSFAQQRLWLLDQLEPGSTLYNIPIALRLRGAVDIEALQRALDFVVARHESLRTLFVYEADALMQRCLPALEVPIEVREAAAQTATEDEQVADFLRQASQRRFDLSRAPLLHCCLLRLSGERHVLAITMHHIVSDGWSSGIFARELTAAYNAFKRGGRPEAAELEIQYADYAQWQRSDAVIESARRQLAYWEERLQGLEPIRLPHDRPRPARQSSEGRTLYFTIPEALTARLTALGRQHASTLFTTLLTAFYVLLHRYTGQSDLAVGSPVSGRNRVELEKLIGFFVNTLVLRVSIDPDASFVDLLQQVRSVVLDAQSHQDVPFDRIVEHLQPERGLSHAPLFQVMFAYQESEADLWEFDGLSATREPVVSDTSKFDLTLSLDRVGAEVQGALEYSTDLFDASAIERLRDHFLNLLEDVAADSHRAVHACRLMSDTERTHLLSGWGRPWRHFEVGQCIHEAFEARAQLTPHADALTFEGGHVGYSLLNARANRLASYIRQAIGAPSAAGPQLLVGICLARTDELVVAILAVLKAGLAYVPIDPSLSRERIRFYLEDSGVSLVIKGLEQSALFDAMGVDAVCIDTERPFIAAMPSTDLGLNVEPERLAYVIYTSGSTGRPKGVMVTHRNVLRLLQATQEWFHFGPDDVWTLFHSTSFDFSVWELWGALLHGGRLVVVPYGVSRSPEAFRQLLAAEKVTVLNQTPSAFRQLIAADRAAGASGAELSLRYVIFGGEALDPASLYDWVARRGDEAPRLINMYGITETTVHVTYRPITRADVMSVGVSPIGVPIPDLRLYLLDARMNPVPVGVIGELFVGGAGLARGYLNRPELTQERFVSVTPPFEVEAGATTAQRLYRTGDLARYRDDGSLEYRGRADDQVKIRGFRIELGEIEAALREKAAVREAVVSAIRDERSGDTRLVAHLVPQGEPLKVEQIRARLKEMLPDYMLPASFVYLDALPLTPNGKLDRKALVAAPGGRPNLASAYAAAGNDVERALVAIWRAVLGVDSIGIFDNFFALGGDSLRGVQVIGRAREQGLDLSLVQLFENQTIAELASAAARGANDASAAASAHRPFSLIGEEDRALLPASAVDAYPLSRMQGGMFYHMQLAPESNVYHCTGTSHLRLRGAFNEAAFRTAVRQVVARHDVLRTSFDLTNFSKPLQIVHREAELPLVVKDLRHLGCAQQEACIRELIESEKNRPFDLSKATLLRFFVYLRSERTLQFTVTECHPIFDGWSYHTMVVEVFNRYAGITGEGRFEEPPPLAVCYRDFIAAEQAAIEDRAQREFWQRKLEDCTILRLPRLLGKKAHAAHAPSLKAVRVVLPEDVYDGLQRLMREASVPMKSVLLAGHVKVMSLASGETDILTGIPANGRPASVGGDQLYGLFLNTLPFRFKLQRMSWAALAQAVFDGERECVAYRRYPLAEIQRLFGTQPLIDEVLFNYMDFHVYKDLDSALGFEALDTVDTGEVNEGTNFALNVHFQHLTLSSKLKSRQISIQLDYDEHRLTRAQIDDIAAYYLEVFCAMSRRPQARHDERCFLAPDTYRRVVEEFSRCAGGYRGRATLAQLYSEQVAGNADTVAVTDGRESLSYSRLNAQANCLAHNLIERGVVAGERVALYLERSLDFIVALLAVIKAEAVYVPLDVEDPRERTLSLLQDTGCRFVLTQQRLAARLDAAAAKPIVLDAAAPTRHLAHDPPVTVDSDHPAYVMYTSGSTGQAKGAVIRQKGIARLVKDVGYVDFKTCGRVLQLAAVGFDASTLEIWGALLNGGTLVLYPPGLPAIPVLESMVVEQNVQTLFLTTSLFNAVVDENPLALRTVKQVISGGEAMSAAHARKLKAAVPAIRLTNAYGPTENTTFTTAFDFEPGTAAHGDPCGESVPIGRPIENTVVHILDAFGHPTPIGTPGELHAGGDGVSSGYLNRDELTRERFIDNPLRPGKGEKLYRTGDLACYLPDGNIQYLGRRDSQVKIRGFRIEMGEIEYSLCLHEQVRKAAVRVVDDPAGKRIAAYVVTQNGAAGDETGLKAFLAQKLPRYMLPAYIVFVPELPLTRNGKLDWSGLPLPGANRDSGAAAIVVPANSLEKEIQEIWGDVLRMASPGLHDNFFDLGGHSLLLARVHLKLQARGHRALSIVDLLNYPSIHALARYLHAGAHPAEASHAEAGESAGMALSEIEQRVLDGRRRLSRLQHQRQDA